MKETKIGIVSCSGEECLGGTISRLATRKVLEKLRMGETVTICLPLFIAGGEEERLFAKVFPTIAVDGCSKLCAMRATEKYSGKVNAVVNVAEILGEEKALSELVSLKEMPQDYEEIVDKVANEICKKIDKIISDILTKEAMEELESQGKSGGGCCCGNC
ncbi:DGC domain-containing protein [Thermoanaerobacter kivui]|uniref:DGC domain-containing protein n=1 Tax=Thermoanaerobacter kivui TaxID=2325 RepID=A0A097AT84_THEKI|nr:putative zinc-binding protein [Thermoanaerobacter kivui]AIS53055.1 DGC domain-containing protein [Thermoanaerobacter kivui]